MSTPIIKWDSKNQCVTLKVEDFLDLLANQPPPVPADYDKPMNIPQCPAVKGVDRCQLNTGHTGRHYDHTSDRDWQ